MQKFDLNILVNLNNYFESISLNFSFRETSKCQNFPFFSAEDARLAIMSWCCCVPFYRFVHFFISIQNGLAFLDVYEANNVTLSQGNMNF